MQNLLESQGFFEKLKNKFKGFNDSFLKNNFNDFMKKDDISKTIDSWKNPKLKTSPEMEDRLFNDFKDFLEKKYNKALNEFDEKDLNTTNLELNQDLNDKIWDGDKLKPEIRLKLLKIAKMFLDSLDLPNLKYKDIVMTGSLANKNYTDESDVDVHIIVDYNDINQDGELLLDYFKMKKNEWGDKYKITLYGYPVELFVQDDGQERDWTSIYSLINDDWVQSPELEPKKEIDKDYIKNEALSMITQIEQWEEMSKDGKNDETILEEIEGFMSRLRDMRSKGLERGGEMDNDNLIFKLLRTGGFLDKIAEIKEKIINKELSVNEKKKDILTEKLIEINGDVDFLYDEYFKNIIDEIKSTNKIPYDKIKNSKTEISTDMLSDELSRKAHQLNPCTIKINDILERVSSNYYNPYEKIISIKISPNAINYGVEYNDIKIATEELDDIKSKRSFLNEFTEARIKGSIYHELSHWIDDSLHNTRIKKALDNNFKKNTGKPIKNVNFTDFEIQAQIHNILQLKRNNEDNWNNLSFEDMIYLSPSLTSIYYSKNVDDSDRINWLKRLKLRMNRENLLGKNMK